MADLTPVAGSGAVDHAVMPSAVLALLSQAADSVPGVMTSHVEYGELVLHIRADPFQPSRLPQGGSE